MKMPGGDREGQAQEAGGGGEERTLEAAWFSGAGNHRRLL